MKKKISYFKFYNVLFFWRLYNGTFWLQNILWLPLESTFPDPIIAYAISSLGSLNLKDFKNEFEIKLQMNAKMVNDNLVLAVDWWTHPLSWN